MSERSRWRARVGCGLILAGMMFVLAAGGLTAWNLRNESVGASAARRLTTLSRDYVSRARADLDGFDVVPDYELDDSRRMPSASLDGVDVVGIVAYPVLGIELPVAAAWDESVARRVPCAYSGSAYDGSLIIAGHSYRAHFGRLYGAAEGDSVIFTDMDGNEFRYVVAEIVTVGGDDVEGLESGEWDLTLFTCTRDSRARVVVRCDEILRGSDET